MAVFVGLMPKPTDGEMLDWLLARARLASVGARWPSKKWLLKQSYSDYVVRVKVFGKGRPFDRKNIAASMRRDDEQAKAGQG